METISRQNKPQQQLIGAHMSAAGGVHKAVERAEAAGATALQVFTRNQRQWNAPPLEEHDAELFTAAVRRWGGYPVSSHASYLINPAADTPEGAERSVALMADELQRAGRLGIEMVVVHPGAHKGQGEAAGAALAAARLDEALERCGSPAVMVLLENTAGQGTMLGASFAGLAAVIEASRMPERYGMCLDTAHAFGAGYDLRDAALYDAAIRELDVCAGLDRLRLVHANDSLTGLGSRRDRHTHIGQGELGEAAFRLLMRDERLHHVPKVLETPKGKGPEEDMMNMAVLRRLACP